MFTTISTENCFIQYRINIDNTVFLFLDTVIENHDHGELCTQRVKWLEEQLENIAPGQQLILFMHHPPLSVSLPWMDAVMLNNSQIFYDIIKDHRIGYVFFGHVHRPVHGIWRGIPYASSRSIGQYQISSHNEQAYRFPVNRESPMYSVISLLNGQIHIDLMDFTNDKVVEQ